MNLSITLNPAFVIANRVAGKFGIGEIINLACVATPIGSNIAALGGVGYRIKEGSGALSAANTVAGTATFTASGKAETVKIAAYGLNDPGKELAVAGLTIIAPTGLNFVKASNIHHTNGSADAGFRGAISLQPAGVSFQRLLIREGEFKGKGSGYYAAQNNMVHPAGAAPVGIINGNHVNGLDTIYSGIQAPPWSDGSFEWYIPWQYQIIGSADWVTFAYATHTEQINALGVVSIGKYNAGPFSAKPSDPNQAY